MPSHCLCDLWQDMWIFCCCRRITTQFLWSQLCYSNKKIFVVISSFFYDFYCDFFFYSGIDFLAWIFDIYKYLSQPRIAAELPLKSVCLFVCLVTLLKAAADMVQPASMRPLCFLFKNLCRNFIFSCKFILLLYFFFAFSICLAFVVLCF